MGGEGNDPVMRKIERLDVLLVGGLAEVKRFGRIGFDASAIEINSKRVSGRRGRMANVAASFSSVCGEARSRSGMPLVTFSPSPPVAEATHARVPPNRRDCPSMQCHGSGDGEGRIERQSHRSDRPRFIQLAALSQ